MPTETFDLASWLDEVFGDDKDTKELIKQKANDAVVNKLKSSVMRLPDYKKGKDELDRLQASIKEKEERLDADFESLTKHRGDLDGVVSGLKKQMAADRRRAAALVLKMQEIAEENGLDPETLGLDELDLGADDGDKGGKNGKGKRSSKTDDDSSDFDTSNFLTKDDRKTISQQILNVLSASADLQDINDEYRELYGKNLPNRKALLNEYVAAAQKSQARNQAVPEMRDFIETKFDFSTKKEERSKKETEAEIERRVNEELDKRRRARESDTRTFEDEELVAGPLVHRKKLAEGNKSVNDVTHARRGVLAAVANSDSKGGYIERKN